MYQQQLPVFKVTVLMMVVMTTAVRLHDWSTQQQPVLVVVMMTTVVMTTATRLQEQQPPVPKVAMARMMAVMTTAMRLKDQTTPLDMMLLQCHAPM